MFFDALELTIETLITWLPMDLNFEQWWILDYGMVDVSFEHVKWTS